MLHHVLRKQDALIHNYKSGFSGFAAHLSAEEARSIAEKPGVVSVFPDPVLKLHTTRSWDFLKYETSVMIESNPSYSTDAIIGILDTGETFQPYIEMSITSRFLIFVVTMFAITQFAWQFSLLKFIFTNLKQFKEIGIWPESESFNDETMGPVPLRWNGTCANGQDSSTFNCNKKIIGARSYGAGESKSRTPRDMMGHGTHVASTAAGVEVKDVSYYGLAAGTAKGGSPGSRLAIYQVFSSQNGSHGSTVLAAFDDAIADGVDVLSLSFGSSPFLEQEFINDPIALGAFHAVQNGITVVCSAGNDGPNPGSVVNSAPWILTVAATTIDRVFESDVVLGNNKVIKGTGINFASIQNSPVYPIIYSKSAKKSGVDENATRNCEPNSMDQEIIKGKIVVCDNEDSLYPQRNKQDEVKKLGGIGVILIDDELRGVAFNFGTFPMTVISSKDGAKPDIAAPGVNILAAWIGNDTVQTLKGKDPPLYNVLSGTSMACPHVSGIAAAVKSRNPTWSPSVIRSAIMTTAAQTNNMKAPITTEKGTAATPYDFGAGEVSTTGPLQPGLVYETTAIDYLNFLCYHGYNIATIKIMANTIPDGFTCPEESSIDLISNINYPSIAISNFDEKAGRRVNRTLTNVAGNAKMEDAKTVYNISIDAPAGLDVQVVPDKLHFSKIDEKSSYQVSFSAANPLKTDAFGSITWSNGRYKVTSTFALSSKSGSVALDKK
ncbi:hypothetical protein Golob_010632 [Gossypium lobatum]|uniref:Uncharacterized protein n=1 Tax=Gossypium lobatum TaxID=34289 RepID=A0A7J8MMF8_9ROSI|nr:hypothetical protein [Gossypium lobatum]